MSARFRLKLPIQAKLNLFSVVVDCDRLSIELQTQRIELNRNESFNSFVHFIYCMRFYLAKAILWLHILTPKRNKIEREREREKEQKLILFSFRQVAWPAEVLVCEHV